MTNVYEDIARRAGLFTGTNLQKEDPELYRAVKRDVLGSQYSLGDKPNLTILLVNAQALINERKARVARKRRHKV